MKLGEIGKYKVLRETDLGYMLVALEDSENEDAEEIFLHRNETNFKKLYPGDVVSAFLYLDKQKRVAATLYEPLITINQGALCKVVNKTTAGAFFDIGISFLVLVLTGIHRIYLPATSGEKENRTENKCRFI